MNAISFRVMEPSSIYRRGRFDPQAWREAVRTRLVSRFGLRLHMTLVLLLVFAAAFVTTRALLLLGVHSMGTRYLVASITGYGAFLGLVRAWLWYVTTEVGHELLPVHAPDEVASAVDSNEAPPVQPAASGALKQSRSRRAKTGTSSRATPAEVDVVPELAIAGTSSPRKKSGSGGPGAGGLDLDFGDGEGCVAVIIVGIVALIGAALFGAAGYVIYQAPSLLGEAFVELMLASVLARSSRKVTREGWGGSVLAATWKPALAVLLVASIGGFTAQRLCPKEITMQGVIKRCVLHRDNA
ncbi:Hypothetical protein A7982_00252 [Minicystis rosea]|nr:Hypothetical protein A7982_00252 [Minicystis rosea]